MSLWIRVEDRVSSEIQLSNEFKNRGALGIQGFYPELYDSRNRCQVTNTLGSDLIADVLTSRRVLVDMYAWPDEGGLIQKYGVDLKFLCELRDCGLVVVCANLPPERYEKCVWLHELLADRRTIWRSIRTPCFFTSIDPSFADRRSDREQYLVKYFAAQSERVAGLCAIVGAAEPPKTAAELAAVVSFWLERLAAFQPELSARLATDIERDARAGIPDLARVHRLVVSPHSAALGGTMKLWRHRWSSLFGEESTADVAREGLLRSPALLSYLAERKLHLTSSDLSAEDVWATMTEGARLRLLGFLRDDSRRVDLITAEENIRLGLAGQGTGEPTREEIESYLGLAQRTSTRLEAIWEGAQIALAVAFGKVDASWLWYVEAGAGLICAKHLLGDPARHVVETLVGKVQIVRALSLK